MSLWQRVSGRGDQAALAASAKMAKGSVRRIMRCSAVGCAVVLFCRPPAAQWRSLEVFFAKGGRLPLLCQGGWGRLDSEVVNAQ